MRCRPDAMAQDDVEQLSGALEPFFQNRGTHSGRVDVLLRLLVAALLQHNALRRLLAVQQLDTFDVEVAYQASLERASAYASKLTALARTLAQAYEALLMDVGEDGSATGSQAATRHNESMPRGRALAVLRDFLTAQSAKDCAIMVALQPLPGGAEDAAPGDVLVADAALDLVVRCKAAFVDLDVKQVTKMPHYLALDRALVALFEEQDGTATRTTRHSE